MKKIIFLLCLITTTSMLSQKSFSHFIDSYELEGKREVFIYLPPSYEEDSERLYPLTVVLDADYLFDLFVGNSILFSQRDKAPEQIIVGIRQIEDQRYVDCAYDQITSYPKEKSESFYRFIRSELTNYIEENYRISPFKTIVGNTLTGNFANYFFIEDNPNFNAFISINPSFAPDMAALLTNTTNKIKNNSYHYYLSSGTYNSKKRHNAILNVNTNLSAKNSKVFKYKYDDLSGATTTSSIGQSIPNALAFIFEIYASISKKEFNSNIKALSPPDAIAYLENKYVEIEYLFGSNLKIRERDIYAIEPIIIDKENGEYLRDFGEMIYKLYPESPLGDYYIGLDFELRGKYKQALKSYKQGYVKFENRPIDAENFYQNIERVVKKI